MIYSPRYASALRCVGQSLEKKDIEVFELTTARDGFRLQAGNPLPPYDSLIEVSFSENDIKILDREGQARRGHAKPEISFDGVSEVLRTLGGYIDQQHARLCRIDNSKSSDIYEPTLEIEYETRAREVRLEQLSMSVIRESAVRMFKRRSGIANPIDLVARRG